MNVSKRIYITKLLPEIGLDMLRKEGFELSVAPTDEPISQQRLISIARERNALITVSSDRIDKYFLRECSHLDLISQFAAGYDNIDIDEATALGIPIGNTPNAMSEATADVAFGLMINVARKMFYMHKQIPQGNWTYFRPKAHLGWELRNKTLGIFGLGRIGMAMASRCRGAYNMNLIYCNRTPNTEAEQKLGARRVSFEELLAQSDIISVHSILSEETKGIFNRQAFQKMKPTAIFINTSRGGIHQETDLTEALQHAEIWGAGLDVTNPEPMSPDNPLLSMENVAVLPHIGSATIEARNAMSRMAAENIIEFYRKGTVPYLVNPEAILKSEKKNA